MTVDYSWEWLSLRFIISSGLLFIYGWCLILSSSRMQEDGKKKHKLKIYGVGCIALMLIGTMLALLSGFTVSGINILVLIMVVICIMVLVYLDGYLTQKAISFGLASEANPLMAILFKRYGFKKMRIVAIVVVSGLIAYYIIGSSFMPLLGLLLIWILVDINNYRVLRKGRGQTTLSD